MQIHRFDTGGYVIHKIQLNGSRSVCHYSAWFDADGNMLDCEQLYPRERAVPANHRMIRRALQTIGKRHVKAPVVESV